MSSFKRLFEPMRIGKMELKNRIVMPPCCSRFASPDGVVTQRMKRYYKERALGGASLITVEYSYIDERESKSVPCQLGAYDDKLLAGLNELAETIQSAGAMASIQLSHAGRQTYPSVIHGRLPVAPSAIPCKWMSESIGRPNICRTLEQQEMEEIVDAFATAAVRVKAAGFNAVEIDLASGYLLCEFLSPYTNKRTDWYGGDINGRARFPLDVVSKAREKVGSDFPIICRLCAEEYVEGGLTLRDSKILAKKLEDSGVDALSVYGANFETFDLCVPPMYIQQGYFLDNAKEIKKEVKIPIITVGPFSDPLQAEEAIAQGKTDIVAMGRALIADPHLPNKIAENRLDDIIPCIRCNEGCIGRFFKGWTQRCAVNYATGHEDEYSQMKPAEKRKRILIVGGGVAGMEAARVAALRGHDVTLYEKEDKVGGHVIAASVPKFKQDLKRLLKYYANQLTRLSVNVKLGKEVTAELVKDTLPDALIVAVGSEPIRPPIVGATKRNVVTGIDVLTGKAQVGRDVVVVGGGLIGCEVALHLADQGARVTVVEMLGDIATDVEPIGRLALKKSFARSGIRPRFNLKLREIVDRGIIAMDGNREEQSIDGDSVVLCLGLKPRTESVKRLMGTVSEVYSVGDCVEPRRIMQAIHEGFIAAVKL